MSQRETDFVMEHFMTVFLLVLFLPVAIDLVLKILKKDTIDLRIEIKFGINYNHWRLFAIFFQATLLFLAQLKIALPWYLFALYFYSPYIYISFGECLFPRREPAPPELLGILGQGLVLLMCFLTLPVLSSK